MLLVVQVKLKDSLMSAISFYPAKDAELAWVDGQIHFSPAGGAREGVEAGNMPILDALSSIEVCGGTRRASV